jgi:hypothetical protein
MSAKAHPPQSRGLAGDCVQAAISYVQYGWAPIPIPFGKKAPELKEWQRLKIQSEDVSQYFRPGMNVGILLGEPSGLLIDVDLDCADALFLASEFLPETNAIFGRDSKPVSHWLFVVKESIETLRLRDLDGRVLLELRSDGCQTVFPPSVHSGEKVEWVKNGLPSLVEGPELRKRVVLLAIACLVIPNWPQVGSRHEVALSFAGGLLGDGLDIESVTRLLRGICLAAGDDEIRDRLETISTTSRKLAQEQPATGWTALGHQFNKTLIDKIRTFVALITPNKTKENEASVDKNRKSGSRTDDRKNAAERLLEIAGSADLYHSPDKVSFASSPVADHLENWPLMSREFRSWLVKLFYNEYGRPPARESMQDAIGVLEAKALFDGPECPVFTRVGHSGVSVFLDLCNEGWEVARITPTGWDVLKESPVRFRRSRGMLSLPTPLQRGSLTCLDDLITVHDEKSRTLLVSWLLAALYPHGPFPILVLQGEAGTAKSTTSLFVRNLIDPSTASLRSMPRDDRDLMISAQNSWVMSFDNLSKMPFWFSDALCRLATGGGLATRELYSNDSEKIFDSMRPIILNGIDDLAVRDDLADRALVINLARIPEDKRKSRRELFAEFETARPRILGGLLEVLSKALANLSGVRLSILPRMADFAQLVTAAEAALEWSRGTFMRVYLQDRADAAAGWVESDSVAVAVLGLMKIRDEWSGTSTELLAELNPLIDPNVRQSRTWPQTAQTLSGRVRRAAPSLRSSGIEIDFDRESYSRRRLIILRKRPQTSVLVDPGGPEVSNNSARASKIGKPEDDRTGGDTRDSDLQSPGPVPKEGRDFDSAISGEPGAIWQCSACGKSFDSRSTWRLHGLLGPCADNRDSLGKIPESEIGSGRGGR